MNATNAQKRLVSVIKDIAERESSMLAEAKLRSAELARDDFVWHYLLLSFSTMGNSRGADGLIADKSNYNRITYKALAALTPAKRRKVITTVCHDAKIRFPNNKAEYITRCFEQVKELGGPAAAKKQLLSLPGREAKIKFLKRFKGIGDKYARNMMMDVYQEDFRDAIAIDSRIKKVTGALGLAFDGYEEHERFYLDAAAEAGLNGWEFDRIMYNNEKEIVRRLSA